MPKVTFIYVDGQHAVVDAIHHQNLMELAVSNLIPGLPGECGGCCSCGSCHVLVDERWISQLPVSADSEIDMLEGLLARRENSRLACQIRMTSELDGLVVRIPAD